jgi:PAS domain S-box-containing protein
MVNVQRRAEHVDEGRPAAASPQGIADRAKLALIAVERTHMPMVVTDPNQADNPVILANGAFLKLTGYTADEVIGRNCRFLQGSQTSRSDVDIIWAAIECDREVTHELLNYRKDGSEFWNELHISPIRDDEGRLIYHFASQLDVTDRVKARNLEAAERLLLREVDHRAKNALALVQGIVRLSRDEDAQEYARSVQGRVDALADAHAFLAEHSWRDVPLSLLVKRRLSALTTGQVHVGGPEVPVAVAQAQPLSLLLHELLMNALVHGALSTPDGKLSVTWRSTADFNIIEVVESGGPAPVSLPQRGFGLTMMVAIAERQLRGRIELDWRPEGLTSRIQLPR